MAVTTPIGSVALPNCLPVSAPVYRRGLRFLIRTQLADGSWHVRSRSKPFQTYYESGFPHGKDQFISITASGWATAALALGWAPVPEPLRAPRGADPTRGVSRAD